MAVSVDSVVARIMELRAQKEELKRKYDESVAGIEAMITNGENWLLAQLQTLGVDSFKTQHGTVYKQLKQRSSTPDWGAFSEWVARTNNVDLLQHRINESNLKAYLEQSGGALPPGVSVEKFVTAVVRKS